MTTPEKPYALRLELDPELGRRLAVQAAMHRTKKISIIRRALERELDRLERDAGVVPAPARVPKKDLVKMVRDGRR
jgi:hypothetical protein